VEGDGGEGTSAAVLRRVCVRRSTMMYIGVSGVLCKHEGDMAPPTQPMQLGACWGAAANFLACGEWWSLSWGGEALSTFASQLHKHTPADGKVGGHGNGGALEGALETAAQLGFALALRGSWGACYDAAKEAGAALAHTLRQRRCGERPVSLLAVSIGARVVWHCLETLASLPPSEGTGHVLDVLLLGAPVTSNPARWERLAPLVSGRMINAYVPADSMLGALYRIDHLASTGCCGNSAVPSHLVENLDATELVHSRAYHFALPAVCDALHLLPTP